MHDNLKTENQKPLELWQNCSMKVASDKINSITATCPACGLLCDDIQLENNKVLNTNCKKALTFFEQPLPDTMPQINGKSASLQQAIAQAAKLIKASQQPLFAGLSTDVQGFRSIYNLAQKTNGNLQHMNAQSMPRNLKVLQSTGWQTTTLTEVKNRADVIVCIGTDVVSHNPRFFERIVWAKDAMFTEPNNREVIYIGENLDTKAGISPKGTPPSLLACRATDLPEITLVLRALVAGKKLKAMHVAGIKISDLQAVADKLKAAKYAVLAWVAKDLDFPHAELAIEQITQIVSKLNNTTRATGLPLGGSDGDTTANYANTWLSGLTLNDESVAHDAVVWVNSFSPSKDATKTNLPLIVLGNANTTFAQTPDVFMPIATPGLDCSGTLFRVDGAVVLPLKKLRENNLPTLAEICTLITKQLSKSL